MHSRHVPIIFSIAAVSLSTVVVLAAAAASDVDKTFVGKVSQGGMYEVEASKFALTHAKAPNVKDVANTEVHDHDEVNVALKTIADAAGISIDTKLNAEFQSRLDMLKSTPTEAFETAYIEDMKTIHDKDEKLFAKEASEGTDAFKTFAHQTDLIVKRHIGELHGND